MKSKIRGLLLYPIRLLLYCISFLTPRRVTKWVFGSNMGFSNNSKYLYIKALEDLVPVGYDIIWIASSKKESKQLNKKKMKSYYKYSLLGLYHSLTAKVYIYNSYISDINAYTVGRALKVNLWHGAGIKNIEYLIQTGPLVKVYKTNNILLKFHYLNHRTKPDLLLSTSPKMTCFLSKAFKVPKESCLEALYPRCEIMLQEELEILKFVEKYENDDVLTLIEYLKMKDKVFLYMPTWRDTGEDFISLSGIDFLDLNNMLKERNSVFIIKLHPATHIDLDYLSKFSNIIYLDTSFDIYLLLAFSDALISDYSTIYLEYLLLGNKSTILYPFDYDRYISESRDLAISYDSIISGNVVYNYTDLKECILQVINDRRCLKNNSTQLQYIKNEFYSCTNSLDFSVIFNKLNKE